MNANGPNLEARLRREQQREGAGVRVRGEVEPAETLFALELSFAPCALAPIPPRQVDPALARVFLPQVKVLPLHLGQLQRVAAGSLDVLAQPVRENRDA